MATFLLKTEPGDYSYDDLVRDKRTAWTGVKNPAARMHMRRITKGDEVLIYHTGDEKRIAGLAKVVKGVYEDPDEPGLTGKGEIKSPIFEIAPVRKAKGEATLAKIKADARFKDFDLVKQSRLSAMEVPAGLEAALREMAGV